MRFVYDPEKAAASVRKHGVSFADAETVFGDPLMGVKEDPDAMGEPRYIAIGLGGASELLVVVFTESEDEIRLISARRATSTERKRYES